MNLSNLVVLPSLFTRKCMEKLKKLKYANCYFWVKVSMFYSAINFCDF